jgi:hypothetical protein
VEDLKARVDGRMGRDPTELILESVLEVVPGAGRSRDRQGEHGRERRRRQRGDSPPPDPPNRSLLPHDEPPFPPGRPWLGSGNVG